MKLNALFAAAFIALFAPGVIALWDLLPSAEQVGKLVPSAEQIGKWVLSKEQIDALFFYQCQVTIYYPGAERGKLLKYLAEPGEPIPLPKFQGKLYYAISDSGCKYREYSKGDPWPKGLKGYKAFAAF
ncbi:hypothetical protein MCOR25_006607 [Pyricularia grisea]|uniref:Uncharacterized protein n=1 Tax=Pyricularia grisea TaxID=148305 RepID=A0A6P8BB41_PYRGI|nr:uncharacterized protein PgNI_04408 [Pyricularia grisea]KAI6360872.1 hypothetical protein MCOR25_006607 [Pyricularia grisea]TLD13056.1 hypothetical protein PgNI_04408 [Pyricularia grisea]